MTPGRAHQIASNVAVAWAAATLIACGSDVKLGPGPYANEVRADTPVLYLRLGETSGDVARDELGEHPGKLPAKGVTLGALSAVVGDANAAVSFDGRSVVTLPSGLDFSGKAPFTVELWAKPSGDSDPTGYGFVVDHQSYDPRIGYTLRVSAFDVAFERWAGGTTFGSNATSNEPVSMDAWHHIAATFDGSNLELYVDGRAVASNGVPTEMPPMTGSWSVGGPNCECSTHFFTGQLDEFALYDHALPPARVRAHFDSGGH